MHEHRVGRKQKNRAGTMASFQSRGARRTTLHRGRAPPFAAVEVEVHKRYRDKRKRGERVTGQWLRVTMKRLVREFCGDAAADSFKATKWWLRSFARRFGISLRRKSNSRAESVLVCLPKIKRWHARLRRRLRRAPAEQLDPRWGRWLPRNRLSCDAALTKEQLERVGTKLKGVLCSKGCGRAFEHAPARVHHEKTCTGGHGYGTPAAVAAAAAEVAAAETVAAEAVAAEATAAAAASDGEDVPPPLAKAPKIRKDGDVKQSGLREGDKKGINHTL